MKNHNYERISEIEAPGILQQEVHEIVHDGFLTIDFAPLSKSVVSVSGV